MPVGGRLQRFQAHGYRYFNRHAATCHSRDSDPGTNLPDHPHDTAHTFANINTDGHSGSHSHSGSHFGSKGHPGSHTHPTSHTHASSDSRPDSDVPSPRYPYPVPDRPGPGGALGRPGKVPRVPLNTRPRHGWPFGLHPVRIPTKTGGASVQTLGGLPLATSYAPERVSRGWKLKGGFDFVLTAFVPATGDSGLEVTISGPPFTIEAVLTKVPQRDEAQASDNVTLLWRQPGRGPHSDIWAEAGLVFAPRFFGGAIEILDVKTGKLLGTARAPAGDPNMPNIIFDVKARGGLLYAATAPQGVLVFDVSQPAAPELLAQYRVQAEIESPENFFNIHNIFLSPDGRYVYAMNQSLPETDLRIIDVSDPTSPREAGRFSIPDSGGFRAVHDINVIERDGKLVAFLNHLGAGLWVLDVTDPASVTVLGSISWEEIFSHSGWPFALGDKLYYAHTSEGYDKHLTVLDVTDLANPRIVSRFATRPGLSIHNVEVVDGIAYIAYYVDGLRVVDLRDPENPKEIGHYDTVPEERERGIMQGAWGVRVMDGVVYVSDMQAGTHAFRVDGE